MKLFRLRRKLESEEEERELVLDTDAERQAQVKELMEAEAEPSVDTPAPEAAPEAAPAAQEEPQPPEAAVPIEEAAPAPEGDLLTQIGAEADREMEAEEKAAEGGAPQGDDALDPDLLDIFREAKNEIQESTLATELEDIPVQELLSDLKGISQRLGVAPRVHPEPSAVEPPEPPAEPTIVEVGEPTAEGSAPKTLDVPDERGTIERPKPPAEPGTVEAPRPPVEPSTPQAFESLNVPDERGTIERPKPPAEASTVDGPKPSGEASVVETSQPIAEPGTVEAPRPPVEPSTSQASEPAAEPGAGSRPPQACAIESPQSGGQSSTGFRHYAGHGLFLALVVATAIGGGLWGAGQLAGGETVQAPPPTVTPVVLGAVVRQDGGAEAWVPPTQEAAPESTSEAVLEPAPEAQPAYSQYTVQFGDTVSSIAEAFSISLDYILWSNPDVIADPSLLRVGEELLIPNVEGIIYRVKPGDTLSSIASSYQIDVESILSFAPNGLTSPDDNIEGMTLVLPGAVPLSLAVQEEIEAAESTASPASDSTPLP